MTSYSGPVDVDVVDESLAELADIRDRDSWVGVGAARRPLKEAVELLEYSKGPDGADPATVRRSFTPLERAARIFHRSPQFSVARRIRDVNDRLVDAHAEVIEWGDE